jgi:hypothetical protein
MAEMIFDERTYLRQQLAELQREYHRQAAPIIEKLVAIESMAPPAPIVVAIAAKEQA